MNDNRYKPVSFEVTVSDYEAAEAAELLRQDCENSERFRKEKEDFKGLMKNESNNKK